MNTEAHQRMNTEANQRISSTGFVNPSGEGKRSRRRSNRRSAGRATLTPLYVVSLKLLRTSRRATVTQ
jgi:hypothetical protein